MGQLRFNAQGLPPPFGDLFTQVDDLISRLWPKTGSVTYDPGSLGDGAGATTTVTAKEAALGDFAMASFDQSLAGITLTAWVSATDTVSVRFQNESGGSLDLASGTLRVRVFKA